MKNNKMLDLLKQAEQSFNAANEAMLTAQEELCNAVDLVSDVEQAIEEKQDEGKEISDAVDCALSSCEMARDKLTLELYQPDDTVVMVAFAKKALATLEEAGCDNATLHGFKAAVNLCNTTVDIETLTKFSIENKDTFKQD